MSRPRPQWQLQALAAQRRDLERRKAEDLQKVAQYFEAHTNTSRHHELWTTEGYYEKANKEAELLSDKKIKAAKLEERRKKLELMLFQEHMQHQEELRSLAAQPRLFRNGSYLNNVPTSTLVDINQGIKDKEEALRRQEAELRTHHAWRMRQPEIRAAQQHIDNRRLKSAWMEQIVEKEVQKKKDEEETRKLIEERQETIRKEIEMEQERLKEKEMKVKELRSGLESQIAELNEKEKAVKEMRQQEEKARAILEELQFLTKEREREFHRLVSERDTSIVNMGLHKYKLKQKVLAVAKEINMDLIMLERIRRAVLKDWESEREKCGVYKRVLDAALSELEEHRERERARQRNIDAMYDGEARQLSLKQEQQWAKERQAREALMSEVLSTLKKQVEEKIEENRRMQKENVMEREKILQDVDSFHQEVCAKEREAKLQNSQYASITSLQSELNRLKLQRERLEERVSKEAEIRGGIEREREVRKEIANMHRRGIGAWT